MLVGAEVPGKWNGIIVLDDHAVSLSLQLHQREQGLSGTASIDGNPPEKIAEIQFQQGLLNLSLRDQSANWYQLRLKPVEDTDVGGISHHGECLIGEVESGDRHGQVLLPSHRIEGTTEPLLIRHVAPQYSEEARKAGFAGTVHLSVLIDASGSPSQIYVLRSLGMGLDEQALDAVKKWRFKPAFLDGQAIPSEVIVEVNFRL